MRRLKILEFALSGLLRRRYKNLAIVVVYAFTVATLASVLFLTHALRAEAGRLLQAAPALVVQSLSAGRHQLIPSGYTERIAALPGVAGATPRIWGYYYDPLTEANYTLIAAPAPGTDLELIEGRLPAGPGEVAIGAGVATLRQTGLGEDLILVDARNLGTIFEVVGVFRSESNLLTHDLVVFDGEELAAFFGIPPERATDIAVEVFNPAEVETVALKIKRLLPDTRPITRTEIIRTYDAVFSWRSGMMLTVFAVALAAFCILAWDKATGISAEEKREIGILKAIGWETADVLELKFWEGTALSVTAFLLGLTGAFLHVFWLGAPLLKPVIQGWSVLFPDFRLVPYLDLYQVFVLGFLTIAPYVASTVVPSWKAAVTDPDSVMRS